MAVEKGKVLAKLEERFKGKSLTKNFKDKIAEKWAAKIDTDDDIDGYIEDREDVILEASTEADRRATQAAAKAKADAEAAKKTDTPKQDDPPADDLPADTPEWAKALMKQNKALAEKVEGFERQKQSDTIADRFKKDDRLKGIPEFMFKGRMPQKEEDFETAVTDLVADFKPFAEQNKLAAFGGDAPAGGGKKPVGKEASKEELDAVMANL